MKATPQPIKKVLIVNRSEIVSRIIRAAWALDIKPVVVYTKDEVQAPYLYEAYEAFQLSKEGLPAYLAIEELLEIAKKAGVDAIHPGYGFLSENAVFAQAVIDKGFYWVGPRPEIIRQMGNKEQSRELAVQLGIPVIPGVKIVIDASEEKVKYEVCHNIGFPALIKDPLSGGGKGTKVVLDEGSLWDAWESVKNYTKRTTKSNVLIVERYLPSTRHIEVQIAGDGEKVIHLYERDCTTQRRYQKIIEEAPSSFVPTSVLQNLYRAALALGAHTKYDSVGTVEFLIDDKGNSYFLEMNTRLQVEHAVTEHITGIDLVALQFLLAAGGKLPYSQEEVTKQGYAIECRLYAENPLQGFLPSTGDITTFLFPHAPFTRVEHALYEGIAVSHHFDPMLAKIISWGKTREEAIVKMRYVLQRLVVIGLVTNQLFLLRIIESTSFKTGHFNVKTFSNPEVVAQLACIDEAGHGGVDEEVALLAYALTHADPEPVQHNQANRSNWKKALWKQRNYI